MKPQSKDAQIVGRVVSGESLYDPSDGTRSILAPTRSARKIPQVAAYEISRLLAGLIPSGDLDRLPEPWRAHVRLLQDTPLESRREQWKDMLASEDRKSTRLNSSHRCI